VLAAQDPPPGFQSVTPRIVVVDVAAAVEFLRAVFGAEGTVSDLDGGLVSAEVGHDLRAFATAVSAGDIKLDDGLSSAELSRSFRASGLQPPLAVEIGRRLGEATSPSPDR